MSGKQDNIELIEKYFGTALTGRQKERFSALEEAYAEWNAKINVISRKDFGSLYLKHVLHSLAIACVCRFEAGARVCDVGSGGGFPAVPLAIMFPDVHFTAVDSIRKKTDVIRGVVQAIGLENLHVVCGRAEELPAKFDYVVSRAVTDTKTLLQWMWSKIERGQKGTLSNGMLCLKGGDLAEELAEAHALIGAGRLVAAGRKFTVFSISDYFDEEFFETKKIVYLPK